MSIEFIDDVEIYDLGTRLWQGGLDTYNDIVRADKEEELEQFLSEIFYDNTPTITQLNDVLWHDREAVYEACGLDENGEIPIDFEDDGEVNERYLEYLETHFDDEGSTYLDYSIENVGKNVYENTNTKYDGTYTTMELSFSSPVDTTGITKEHFDEYIEKLTNNHYIYKSKTTGIIVNEYKVEVDDSLSYEALLSEGHIPSMNIQIQVLGRILSSDIAEIFDFMDEVYNSVEDMQEYEDELNDEE